MKKSIGIALIAGLGLSSTACADTWGITDRQALGILLPPLITLFLLSILCWRYSVQGERLAFCVGSFLLWLFALGVIPLFVKLSIVQFAVSRWAFETYIAYFAAIISITFGVLKWRDSVRLTKSR